MEVADFGVEEEVVTETDGLFDGLEVEMELVIDV